MADCEGCELVVADRCDQVQIDVLKSCKVFVGASSEAVFVRNCSDSVFYLACKQLRTRDCVNCTFYLYAQTEPIIETSTGMKFAPFKGGYAEQAAHMAAANLNPTINLWWGLFDFNDEAKTGKNWSYVPDAEQAEPWFPNGGADQVCAITAPGSRSSLPSQNGGNFGNSSGGMMSFDFNTSLEAAEQAHLEMEANTQPPPPAAPPAAPAAAPPPPVAEMAAATIAPPAPAPPAGAGGAPPPPPAAA
jgi:protein XRP2